MAKKHRNVKGLRNRKAPSNQYWTGNSKWAARNAPPEPEPEKVEFHHQHVPATPAADPATSASYVTPDGIEIDANVPVDERGYVNLAPTGDDTVTSYFPKRTRLPGQPPPDYLPPETIDAPVTKDDLPPWSDRYSVEPDGSIATYWRKTPYRKREYVHDPFS